MRTGRVPVRCQNSLTGQATKPLVNSSTPTSTGGSGSRLSHASARRHAAINMNWPTAAVGVDGRLDILERPATLCRSAVLADLRATGTGP